MFKILADKTICLTRGDVCNINVTATMSDGSNYVFTPGDVVRLKVFSKKDSDDVQIQKDVLVQDETQSVVIGLVKEDTRLGDTINKPFDYWYEIELNPDTEPQTIIGYDQDGEKIFRLYPDGGDLNVTS